jgi:hypothetical protein
MADSDSSEEESIHSLADVPVLRYADPRDPIAIYTFLGLATLPRLRPGNPLRLLPREMVLKIARFAHGYRAGWEGVGRAGQLADAVDVSNYSDVCGLALKMPPMRSGIHYVEIDLRIAWFGTRIFFESADNSRHESFGLELTYWEDDHDDDGERESDKAVDLFYVAGRPGARRVDMQRISAFNDCWTWCDGPVIFGCLVDMVLDCVTFRINGVDGPCVRFPGFPWRSGWAWTICPTMGATKGLGTMLRAKLNITRGVSSRAQPLRRPRGGCWSSRTTPGPRRSISRGSVRIAFCARFLTWRDGFTISSRSMTCINSIIL